MLIFRTLLWVVYFSLLGTAAAMCGVLLYMCITSNLPLTLQGILGFSLSITIAGLIYMIWHLYKEIR